MITINEFQQWVGYRNLGTTPFLWSAYGANAMIMDSQATDHFASNSAVAYFDSVTGKVFQLEAWDTGNDREYRWIDPDYAKPLKKEHKKRGISYKESSDGRKFIEIDVLDDIREKICAIITGQPYDTRIMVEVDLDDDLELQLYRQAHACDMTVNQYVEHILRQVVDAAKTKEQKEDHGI